MQTITRPLPLNQTAFPAIHEILWDRWEVVALELANLRDKEPQSARIAVILREYRGIDELFPPTCFEPEYDEKNLFVEWH